jgi:hypothetical protein
VAIQVEPDQLHGLGALQRFSHGLAVALHDLLNALAHWRITRLLKLGKHKARDAGKLPDELHMGQEHRLQPLQRIGSRLPRLAQPGHQVRLDPLGHRQPDRLLA